MVANQWQQLSGIPLYCHFKLPKGLLFRNEHDYAYYLKLLTEMASKYVISIHAFSLLPNQIHLLASQYLSYGSVSVLLQNVHRAYGLHYSRTHSRGLRFSDSCYHYCPVEANDNAMAVSLYIESLARTLGTVAEGEGYQWQTNGSHPRGLTWSLNRWEGCLESAQRLLTTLEPHIESLPVIGSTLFKHRMKLRTELSDLMLKHDSPKAFVSKGTCEVTKKEYQTVGFYLDDDG